MRWIYWTKRPNVVRAVVVILMCYWLLLGYVIMNHSKNTAPFTLLLAFMPLLSQLLSRYANGKLFLLDASKRFWIAKIEVDGSVSAEGTLGSAVTVHPRKVEFGEATERLPEEAITALRRLVADPETDAPAQLAIAQETISWGWWTAPTAVVFVLLCLALTLILRSPVFLTVSCIILGIFGFWVSTRPHRLLILYGDTLYVVAAPDQVIGAFSISDVRLQERRWISILHAPQGLRIAVMPHGSRTLREMLSGRVPPGGTHMRMG